MSDDHLDEWVDQWLEQRLGRLIAEGAGGAAVPAVAAIRHRGRRRRRRALAGGAFTGVLLLAGSVAVAGRFGPPAGRGGAAAPPTGSPFGTAAAPAPAPAPAPASATATADLLDPVAGYGADRDGSRWRAMLLRGEYGDGAWLVAPARVVVDGTRSRFPYRLYLLKVRRPDGQLTDCPVLLVWSWGTDGDGRGSGAPAVVLSGQELARDLRSRQPTIMRWSWFVHSGEVRGAVFGAVTDRAAGVQVQIDDGAPVDARIYDLGPKHANNWYMAAFDDPKRIEPPHRVTVTALDEAGRVIRRWSP